MTKHRETTIVARTWAEAKAAVGGPLKERAKTLLLKNHTKDPITKCWVWKFSLNCKGYAQMRISYATITSYIVSHIVFKGPIPDGFEVDHLCRNRKCINPEHLEAVTMLENRRRTVGVRQQPTCPYGHPYVEGSYRFYPEENVRRCLACMADRNTKWIAATKHKVCNRVLVLLLASPNDWVGEFYTKHKIHVRRRAEQLRERGYVIEEKKFSEHDWRYRIIIEEATPIAA